MVSRDTRTPDEVLADAMSEFKDDPLGYVMFCFPWDSDESIQVVKLAEGVPEILTKDDLERQAAYRARFPGCKHGPDLWACDFLDQLGEEIKKRGFDGHRSVDPIRFSTVSGHEIGKSCKVSWLIKFILDTRPFSKGSVTAVTDEQLRTKTWGELGKWHHMSLTSHWFRYSSARGSMSLVHTNERYAGTWRCDARTCREEKSEAFAGQHSPTATSFYIFDEASGVPDKVYEVREGGLTSGEPMVFDFGNGTRNSGAFYENCVGRRSARYIVRSIDSRHVAITNKDKIAQDIEDFGEDSDFVRVRWRGLFPSRGSAQFIPSQDVREAMAREVPDASLHQLVLGVDVARFGDDSSVICVRRGPDARTFLPKAFKGLDTVQLTDHVAREFAYYEGLGIRPAVIYVDGGGIGGGVVDQLNSRGYPVIEVQFGSRPSDIQSYRFKVDEMYGRLRDYLPRMALPEEGTEAGQMLFEDLTQREYGYTLTGQKINLESKSDMKKRGLKSPDYSDALVVTFATEMSTLERVPNIPGPKNQQPDDYDPYERI